MDSVAQGVVLVFYGIAVVAFVGAVLAAMLGIFIWSAIDIFHREDLGIGKLVWLLVILALPLIGVAIYWLSRPVYGDQPHHHYT